MVEIPDNSNGSSNNKRHWHDHAAVWAAVAAALAAAVAAGAGAWQGLVANQGVVQARIANEIATRPYIKIDILPESFAIGTVPQRGGSVMSIQFTITNTGKLPAPVRVQTATSWQSVKHQLDQSTLRSYSNLGQRFLFPEQDSGRFTSYTNGLSDGEMLDLKANSSRQFYIRVMALYGPDEQHLGERSVLICNAYQINWNGEGYSLGAGETDPGSDNEGCNQAR